MEGTSDLFFVTTFGTCEFGDAPGVIDSLPGAKVIVPDGDFLTVVSSTKGVVVTAGSMTAASSNLPGTRPQSKSEDPRQS